jgi:hypothetical protein
MVRPQVDLEPYRNDIEHRIFVSRQPLSEILDWLASQGVTISQKTLRRRTKEWGASRRGVASDEDLIARLDQAFHHTTNNDETIAQDLNSQGFPISARQVKEARLQHGWRRRADDAEQMWEQRMATFAQVEQALAEGTVRSYGREFLVTNCQETTCGGPSHVSAPQAIRYLCAQGLHTCQLLSVQSTTWFQDHNLGQG